MRETIKEIKEIKENKREIISSFMSFMVNQITISSKNILQISKIK